MVKNVHRTVCQHIHQFCSAFSVVRQDYGGNGKTYLIPERHGIVSQYGSAYTLATMRIPISWEGCKSLFKTEVTVPLIEATATLHH
jgi:hypothetical protein